MVVCTLQVLLFDVFKVLHGLTTDYHSDPISVKKNTKKPHKNPQNKQVNLDIIKALLLEEEKTGDQIF